MKKILSIMLAAVMVLAAPMSTQAAGYAVDISTKTKIETMVPTTLKTGSDEEFAKVKSYGIAILNDADKKISVPIQVAADGVLEYQLYDDNKELSGTTAYSICKDEAGLSAVDKGELTLGGTDKYHGMVKVTKGTYYLVMNVSETTASTVEEFYYDFQGVLYTKGNKVLKNNTWAECAGSGASKASYYKVTVTKPSRITFGFDGYDKKSVKVTLCNSAKKAISAASSLPYNSQYISSEQYYVNKGTYYVKVVTANDIYRVQYKSTSYTDPAGKSSSKPKSLKVNKTTKGYVAVNDKKGTKDYYKCATTKSGQLKGLSVAFSGQGSIKVTIKAPGVAAVSKTIKSGQVYYINNYYQEYRNSSGTYRKNIPFPKGTYTITVTKSTAGTNGVYSVGTKYYSPY